ncbi:MAG: DUF2764 domain-containing protein [Bacteroidales bacterium]|nr:DUF2764 domain-containing protein [Bacteroidales bacterium]
MFKREYHYLVAGLPDFVLERDVKDFDLRALVDEIYGQIKDCDRELIRQFLMPYDHLNLHHLMRGREDLFDNKGYYSLDFLKTQLEKPDDMPEYMIDFVQKFKYGHESSGLHEEYRKRSYYIWLQFYQKIAEKSKNRFIRLWWEFDHILRNIQAAWMCRKLGEPMQKQLIGWDEEIDYFVKNNLPDFGLRREIPFGEQIFNLLDEEIDLLEREFRFDQIRWQLADELTTFNYFDMDKILAFLVKADILDRWLKLDKERGAVLFDGFVKTLVEQKNIDL